MKNIRSKTSIRRKNEFSIYIDDLEETNVQTTVVSNFKY